MLLAAIFVLFSIFGFVGLIYPTAWHKGIKLDNRLKNLAVWLGSFIVFFVVVINSPDSEPQKTIESQQVVAKKQENWQDTVKKIATSSKTETDKFDEVMIYAKNYQPTKQELSEFEDYIVGEFTNGNYLTDIKNHEYMLTNIFKAAVIDKQYDDKEQSPIDHFAFDFLQNTKYTYRGVDAVDSTAVKANERQMKRSLDKMK